MNKIILTLFLAISFFACKQNTPTVETPEGTFVGEQFEVTDVIDYADLASHVSQTDSVAVKVRGKVSAVCQKKGCWMNIVRNEGDTEMMVRFKDYGFFMPLDLSGQEVVMNGKAFYQVTPVEDLRHYAEDAGKSEEEIAAITEPKKELTFYADGVLLLNEE